MWAPVPAFEQAVVHHREAAAHLAAARCLSATHQALDSTHQATLQRLSSMLGAQSAALTRLANRLGVALPGMESVAPRAIADLAEALGRAQDSARHAEASLHAAQKELLPALLPTASSTVRTVLIYGGWSLLGWLAQCALLAVTSGTNATALITSLCGMPLFAFLAALLTLQYFGQPRTGPRNSHPVKLGAIICFLGMPIGWVVLVAVLVILR